MHSTLQASGSADENRPPVTELTREHYRKAAGGKGGGGPAGAQTQTARPSKAPRNRNPSTERQPQLAPEQRGKAKTSQHPKPQHRETGPGACSEQQGTKKTPAAPNTERKPANATPANRAKPTENSSAPPSRQHQPKQQKRNPEQTTRTLTKATPEPTRQHHTPPPTEELRRRS